MSSRSGAGDRAARRSGVVATLGALLLVGSALVAAPAAARGTGDPPRTGYSVRADGTAAGGWFGSRTAARRAVFRIDPRALPRTPGFRDGGWRRVVDGSGPRRVGRWAVRRAAWLVSKYGTYDSDAQAAAVEAALHDLLHGGAYRLAGAQTRRRLSQTGAADTVVALARYMLDASTRLAGPYRVRVEADGAVVGRRARFTVTVTARRTGEPVPQLPVEIRYDGRRLDRTTDAAGAVVVDPVARIAGPRQVVAIVGRVPSDRLFVRRPTRRGASRIVVAGRKIVLTRRDQVAIRARPAVRVTAADVGTVADPVPGAVHLADGYPSGRSATVTLHGPFALDEPTSCDPTRALRTETMPVSRDGRYPVPEVRVSTAGIYRWSVRVPGDDYNLAAGRCGQTVLLKAVPTLTVRAVPELVGPGDPARARVGAGELPAGYARDAIVRLYGPFVERAGVRCVADRQLRRRIVPVVAPRTAASTSPVTLARPGLYAWQAVLPGTDLAVRAATRCAAPDTLLRVR